MSNILIDYANQLEALGSEDDEGKRSYDEGEVARTSLDDVSGFGRSVGQGFVETFFPSPATSGWQGLVPNFVWTYAALPETLSAAFQGRDAEGEMVRLSMAGLQRAAGMFDLPLEPQSTGHLAGRFVGASLIPIAPIITAASKAGKAAEFATRLFLPGMQSRRVWSGGLEIAIPTVAFDQVLELMDKDPEKYASLFESGAFSFDPRDAVPRYTTFDQLMGKPRKRTDITGLSAWDTNFMSGDWEQLPPDREGEGLTLPSWILGVGLGLLGGAAGATKIRSSIAERAARSSLVRSASEESTRKFRETPTTTVTEPTRFSDRGSVQAQTLDVLAPAKIALREAEVAGVLPPGVGPKLVRQLEVTMQRESIGSQVVDSMRTGTLPGFGDDVKQFRITTPAYTLNRYAQLIRTAPDEARMVKEQLTAGTVVDDMLAQGYTVWGTGAQTKTLADLQGILNAPVPQRVATLVEDFRQTYRDMGEYLEAMGFLEPGTRAKWMAQANNYVPLQINPHGGASIKTILTPRHLANSGVGPGEAMDPALVLGKYVSNTIQAVEQNSVRLRILQALEGSMGIHRTKKPANAVTVMEAGQPVNFYVPDGSLRRALQNSPHVFGPVMQSVNKLGRFTKFFLTGRGAPEFALISAGMEMATALVTQPKGYNIGILGKTWEKLTGNKWDVFDPTVVLNVFNTINHSAAVMAHSIARRLDTSIGNNDWLLKTLGAKATQKLKDVMEAEYLRSTHRMYEKYAGTGVPVFGEADEVLSRLDVEISPLLGRTVGGRFRPSASPAGRAYSTLLSALHQSVREGSLAANRKPQWTQYDAVVNGKKTKVIGIPSRLSAEIEEFVGEARKLTGDMAKRGGQAGTRVGDATRRYTDSVLYAPVWLQVSSRMAEAFRDRPMNAFFGVAAPLAASVYYVQNHILTDSDLADFFFNDMTASQRGRWIPWLFKDEDGEVRLQTLVSLPQELRPAYSMVMETMKYAGGYFATTEEDAALMMPLREAMQRVFQDILPNPIPHAVNVGIAAIGQEPPDVNLGNLKFRDLQGNREVDNSTEGAWLSWWRNFMSHVTAGALDVSFGPVDVVAKHLDKDGAVNYAQMFKDSVNRMTSKVVKESRPTALLFKADERVMTAVTMGGDQTVREVSRMRDTIDVYTQHYRMREQHPGTTKAEPLTSEGILPRERGTFKNPEDAQIAQLLEITFGERSGIGQSLARHDGRMADLDKLLDFSEATNKDARTIAESRDQINRQRKKIMADIHTLLRLGEESIRQQLPGFSLSALDESPPIMRLRRDQVKRVPKTEGASLLFGPAR
jgi:hypothetical protein